MRAAPESSPPEAHGSGLRMTPDQKKSNLRLALILAAIAVAVFVGFIVKSALVGV